MENAAGNRTRRQLLKQCTLIALAVIGGSAFGALEGTAPVILVVGDSLSAEYGIARGKGWVALLEQQLAEQKISAKVVNASISGETTSGGRSRLPALLKRHAPAIVILELGSNDALRGFPLAMTRDNLAFMARSAREAGARVILLGMQMPPNYGRKYAADFVAMFTDVAHAERATLVPFLLRGVADVPNAEANFQPDRIHPRQEAQPTMLANVWQALKPLLH